MIILLNHDNTTVIGVYDNLLEAVLNNFTLEFTSSRQLKTTSKLFDSYINKNIISTFSYADTYTKEEAIRHYTENSLKRDIKRYGINIYQINEI
jgi:hypothetical protein